MNQMGYNMNPMNMMMNQMNIPMMMPMNMQMNQLNNNIINPISNNINQTDNKGKNNSDKTENSIKRQNINKKKFSSKTQISGTKISPLNRNNNNNDNEDEFIGLTKKEIKENEEREKNGKIKINPLGCGRKLDWKEMEDCSDEVIEKLKEIAVDDYYSGLLKINDDFKK